jgi:hypothetical protein
LGTACFDEIGGATRGAARDAETDVCGVVASPVQ